MQLRLAAWIVSSGEVAYGALKVRSFWLHPRLDPFLYRFTMTNPRNHKHLSSSAATTGTPTEVFFEQTKAGTGCFNLHKERHVEKTSESDLLRLELESEQSSLSKPSSSGSEEDPATQPARMTVFGIQFANDWILQLQGVLLQPCYNPWRICERLWGGSSGLIEANFDDLTAATEAFSSTWMGDKANKVADSTNPGKNIRRSQRSDKPNDFPASTAACFFEVHCEAFDQELSTFWACKKWDCPIFTLSKTGEEATLWGLSGSQSDKRAESDDVGSGDVKGENLKFTFSVCRCSGQKLQTLQRSSLSTTSCH